LVFVIAWHQAAAARAQPQPRQPKAARERGRGWPAPYRAVAPHHAFK
jgi:hypothetical protein